MPTPTPKSTLHKLTPLPSHIGYGFSTSSDVSISGYKVEKTGMYTNYYFTQANHKWPLRCLIPPKIKLDGFSPNLNKTLHVGHLRNLITANALKRIFNADAVAMLGASLGVNEGAKEHYESLCKYIGYWPVETHIDIELPDTIKGYSLITEAGTAECWNGAGVDVIIKRSDGRRTYAAHDLEFAKLVNPDYYITGQEQRDHFKSLGLLNKHIPIGLVLGKDGTKIKSRDGTALPLNEAIEIIQQKLSPSPDLNKLAWNIIIWNFLKAKRTKDIKFNEDEWCKTESPGMYISYTLARIYSALKLAGQQIGCPALLNKDEVDEIDIPTFAIAEYAQYYLQQAIDMMDPSPIANYIESLCSHLNYKYQQEQIVGGRASFQKAIFNAYLVLNEMMGKLGMFTLEKV